MDRTDFHTDRLMQVISEWKKFSDMAQDELVRKMCKMHKTEAAQQLMDLRWRAAKERLAAVNFYQ